MRPFRNTGWPLLDQVQAIIPAGTGARGHRAFRTTGPIPSSNFPGQAVDVASVASVATAELSGLSMLASTGPGALSAEASGSHTAQFCGAVDATATLESMPATTNMMPTSFTTPNTLIPYSTSVPMNKRTHSTMSADDTSSALGTYSEDTSFNLPVGTSVKKMRESSGGPRSSSSKPGSKPTESKAGSRRSASGKVASQAAHTAAIMGMQGSINHLTDVFADSMRQTSAEEAVVLRRKHALQILQGQKDLTPLQKARLASFFQKDISVADTYVSLVDPQVREEWINLMLAV